MRLNYLLKKINKSIIIGTDETNVFSLAGPLVAGAYITKKRIKGVKDSKKLTRKKIKELAEKLKNNGLYYIDFVTPEEFDQLGMKMASIEAKRRAVLNLIEKYKLPKTKILLITDGLIPISCGLSELAIPHADEKIYEVSAASIIAKAYLNDKMEEYDRLYPGYNFKNNTGSPGKSHYEAILRLGFSPIHRKKFCLSFPQLKNLKIM